MGYRECETCKAPCFPAAHCMKHMTLDERLSSADYLMAIKESESSAKAAIRDHLRALDAYARAAGYAEAMSEVAEYIDECPKQWSDRNRIDGVYGLAVRSAPAATTEEPK